MIDCVKWTSSQLEVITLLDLSKVNDAFMVRQCTGRLKSGNVVNVSLPFVWLPLYGLRQALVKEAKKAGVFAKGLGLFDAIRTSVSTTP